MKNKNDKKYAHLTYKDRCIIHEFLNYGYSFTAISNRIHKDRTTVSKEIRNHRFVKPFGKCSVPSCERLDKPPYVCNGCNSTSNCYKAKYMYDAAIADHEYRFGRQYMDFQDYMELHPMASIVEMDTVIGTSGGKGGKCFLTLLFRSFNFMLIFLLPYKRVQFVNEVFHKLKKTLGDFVFSRLFEIILTDYTEENTMPKFSLTA